MPERNKGNRLILFAIVFGFSLIVILFFISSQVLAQSGDSEVQKQIHIFLEMFEYVRDNYVDEDKLDPKTLIEGALSGMLKSLDDPHSVYLTLDDMEDMSETTVGKFGGVGIYILEVEKGIEVARPIPGTPAYKAGINAGDIIIAVDDESIVDLDIDAVIDRLKGKPGTKVKMTVLRGLTKTLDFTVTREMIEIPTVHQAMIDETIAYLKINQFTPLTFDQVKEAIDFFEDRSYGSLIIDLRSNPGGLLSSAVDVADLFFPYGKLIVYTKSRIASENVKLRARRKQNVPSEIPIIVLIDKYSASAAEILTGVLKDTQRATIVGEKSYGKGSVQVIRDTGDGGGVKLTISKYYTPSGVVIHGVGIEPDIAVKEEEWTEEDRAALNKIYESDKITRFAEQNSEITDTKIDKFIVSLKAEGIVLGERYIRKLIRNELNRTNNNPPVYDLDYDIVLQKAVEILKK